MRFIFNPSTGNLESTDNVTSPLKPLGERFFSGGQPLPNDPTEPINPWIPKPIGPPLPNKMMAAKGGLARQPFAPENVERVATPKYVINPKNVDLEFKPEDKKVKLYKKATWDKIYQYKKAIEKLITDFEKTKILPNEKFEITTNKILKLLKLKLGSSKANQVKHAVSLIDSKKFPHIISRGTQIQQSGDPLKGNALTDQQKTYYKKNYKNMGISQIAQHFSKLPQSNKKTRALKSAFDRFKWTLVTKGFINPKEVFMQTTQPGTGYKIKDYNAWNAYEAQRNRLANLDPETWNQEKYIGTKGKYKGKFAPYKLDGELLKFLNLNMLRGSLHEKWPKHLLPSLEHSTGITAADIIGDSEGLRKVEANTRRWNFKETGAKSNLYKQVKSYLRTAKSAFGKGMVTEGNEALKVVNELYDKLAKRFNLNRKKFPFYKWQGGKIAEVNVKGVIKQGTVSEAFLEFFKNVVRDATPAELAKIKRIQPSIHEVLIEIKNGNTAKAKELIKVNAGNKAYVSGKHTSNLFNFAGGIDSSMFPNIELSPKLTNALSKAGNVVKAIGAVAAPANLIPYGQEIDRGMGKRSIDTGTARLLEDFVNMPKYVTQLAGALLKKDLDLPYEAKFGRMYSDWVAKGIPLEKRMEKIEELGKMRISKEDEMWNPLKDMAEKKLGFSSTVEADQYGYSPERVQMLKEKAQEPLLPESGDVEIKETENVFGTQIPMKSITEGFSRDQFMAKGGRVGFANGSEDGEDDNRSDEAILESIKKQMFELEQGWNTGKSIPGKIMDVARVDNWPYYAARMLKAGMNVAEVSAKLPFVGIELLQKLATQPAFKVVPGDTKKSAAEIGLGESFSEGMDDSWITDQPHNKLEGQGLFKEAFGKLMPGTFADKTGVNSLISDMEDKMKAQGQSNWGEIAGKNIEMGLDISLPFGYVAAANKYKALEKSLTPFISGKNPSKVIEEALTEKGMNRREFNKLLVTGGAIGALKFLGLDNLLKGVARNPVPGSIKMLERSTTKMPVWFPKFIDKVNDKMTYHGDGMWSFKGTDDFLPGFHIERIGDDYYISGKNEYDQDFSITYESPKWEGDADGSYYNSGEFVVEDSVPMRSDPDGNVDFDGEVVEDIHDVLGGTKGMEEIATGEKIGLTRGDQQVIDAEVRFQSDVDMARDLADE